MSYTDRELLVLAAKAAGIKALQCPDGIWRYCAGLDPMFNIFAAKQWNPLTDDGDALRLSVALRINLEHAGHIHGGRLGSDRIQASPRGLGHLGYVQMYEGDPLSATRRCIVLAAAEIGKAMQDDATARKERL
jgi:hypothetical protein